MGLGATAPCPEGAGADAHAARFGLMNEEAGEKRGDRQKKNIQVRSNKSATLHAASKAQRDTNKGQGKMQFGTC